MRDRGVTRPCPKCGYDMRLDGTTQTTQDWSCVICGMWGRRRIVDGKWISIKQKTVKKVIS